MVTIGQPSLLTAAYAAGVLMFFAPCSVGLLPAYLTYYFTHDAAETDGGTAARAKETANRTTTAASDSGSFARQLLLANGVLVFLVGAVPLFYMATAGIRLLLPGYDLVVPLARLGTGSYLPPAAAVFVGTGLSVAATGRRGARGLRVGGIATLGIILLYLLAGGVVLVVGGWVRPYLATLELLVGPLLVALGIAYYLNVSPLRTIELPERGTVSDSEFFTFGLLYGVGSLACNLPVFLGVVLSSFFTEGFPSGLAVFAAFAAGMGTLMVGLSVVASLTEGSLSLGRYAAPARTVGSAAFVLIGLYVTWYTLRAFGLLPTIALAG